MAVCAETLGGFVLSAEGWGPTGNVKKCAVEKRPKTYGSTEMHPFSGVERSGTEQNGCGAPRGGQAAGCVFFRTHSLYAAGGNPPRLTVVILTRL